MVHEVRSSSWWNGTWTTWCGMTVAKKDVDRMWLASVDCDGCKAALRAAGKKAS